MGRQVGHPRNCGCLRCQPRTREHEPLCDDNGWNHPGPCVIETDLPADTEVVA